LNRTAAERSRGRDGLTEGASGKLMLAGEGREGLRHNWVHGTGHGQTI